MYILLELILIFVGLFICTMSIFFRKYASISLNFTWGAMFVIFFIICFGDSPKTDANDVIIALIVGLIHALISLKAETLTMAVNCITSTVVFSMLTLYANYYNQQPDDKALGFFTLVLPIIAAVLYIVFRKKYSYHVLTSIIGGFYAAFFGMIVLNDSSLEKIVFTIISDTITNTTSIFTKTEIAWFLIAAAGGAFQILGSAGKIEEVNRLFGIKTSDSNDSTESETSTVEKLSKKSRHAAGINFQNTAAIDGLDKFKNLIKSLLKKYGITKTDILMGIIPGIMLISLFSDWFSVFVQSLFISIIAYAIITKSLEVNLFFHLIYIVQYIFVFLLFIVTGSFGDIFEHSFFGGLFFVVLTLGKFVFISLIMLLMYGNLPIVKYKPIIMTSIGFIMNKYIINDNNIYNLQKLKSFTAEFGGIDVISYAAMIGLLFFLFKKFEHKNIFTAESFVSSSPTIKKLSFNSTETNTFAKINSFVNVPAQPVRIEQRCYKCGGFIMYGSKYCGKCGTLLDNF